MPVNSSVRPFAAAAKVPAPRTECERDCPDQTAGQTADESADETAETAPMTTLPRDRPVPAAADGLGARIRRRAWSFVLDKAAGVGDAARQAPQRLGAGGAAALCKLAAAAPARMLGLARTARRVRPGSAFLVQAEAILTARARGWDAAGALFLDPRARRTPGAAQALLRRRATPPLDLALPARDRPAHLPEAAAARIVVYTAVFGADPAPPPLFYEIPGLRFVCLTDRADLAVPGWRSAPAAPPAPAAAWCRILAHRALAQAAPQAEASLWLAPDRWLVGNLQTLLARWCLPQDLALWRHGGGVDWHDLAEHRLIGGAVAGGSGADGTEADQVLAQAQDCAARALPREAGAWDTGMIWRRHTPQVAALMEAWWAEHARFPGGLDAIALYAALHGAGPGSTSDSTSDSGPGAIRPRLLPAALGTAEDNAFATRIIPATAARAADPPRGGRIAGPPASGPPASGAARPGAGGARTCAGKLPIAFVYAERYALSASTVLRGRQLSELIAARYSDRYDVRFTPETAGLRDQVVVLTKGALETLTVAEIAALRRRNRAVIGSWDDLRPAAAKVAETDATMTISYRQTRDCARRFPRTPSYLVGHHVNTAIPASTPPMDRPRVGYFGYLSNTLCPSSLQGMVDLIKLDTANVQMSWIDLLPRYNCHWIVRRSRRGAGGKPFLKGFVAARCGAVVVVGRDDEDAVQYLGDDYPFYVRRTDPAGLEYQMMEIAAAFGGPDWRRAQQIMAQVAARSTDAVFCAEFRAMIDAVTG